MNKSEAKLPIILLLLLSLGFSFDTFSQEFIPQDSGFGGYLFLGPGSFYVRTNRIYTGPPLLGDSGKQQISSIFEPAETNRVFAFAVAGELNYTFAGSRTQLFMGNRLEELIRLDVPFNLGVRQELKDKGIMALSVLFTPLQLKYWEDPYVENEDRRPMELSFPGIRFRWTRIMNTGFNFAANVRWYRFKEERSGDWLIGEGRLDPSEQFLLERDGKVIRLEGSYRFRSNRHVIQPRIRYVDDDHRGEAMAVNGYGFEMNYGYRSQKLLLDFKIAYGYRRGKAVHPVYDTTLSTDRFGLALALIIPTGLFNSRDWNIWITGESLREDANIAFFEARLASIMGGLMWRPQKKKKEANSM